MSRSVERVFKNSKALQYDHWEYSEQQQDETPQLLDDSRAQWQKYVVMTSSINKLGFSMSEIFHKSCKCSIRAVITHQQAGSWRCSRKN